MAPFRSFRLIICIMMVLQRCTAATNICQEKVADVVFLLDSSHSIWTHQFTTQLEFLQRLIDSFMIGPNHIRVGIATFSTSVRLDVALNQHMDKLSLRRAIGEIEYMQGGTRTDSALHFAHSQMFTAEHGSRPWAAHIIILITDGYSYNPENTSFQASEAKSKGIEIFAIGVGNGVDETELRAVASNPDESHVFQVENYQALQGIESALAKKTCHKVNGTSDDEESENSKDTVSKRCAAKEADVFILLDGSSSIWKPQFYQQLHFSAQLLHNFDIGSQRTRVALAVFSDDVTPVMMLTDPQSDASVREALDRAPYLTGYTNTGKALHYVRTKGFAEARNDVAHVIVVLTDGQSTNATHTMAEARAAREQGIHVFAVGIGPATDAKELMEMANDPDENYVFHVDDFSGLKNIRDLLAIKVCDVESSEYQGDQSNTNSDCFLRKPTDVIFVYDSAEVNRVESDLISDVIRYVVEEADSNPDTVRYGLLRENCYKGDNVDLKTGGTAEDLMNLLQKPHHEGLHMLLKKARLHGYLSTYDPQRSRVRKVIVLFVGSKMADASAVEKEIKRILFIENVKMVVVAVNSARDHYELFTQLTGMNPVVVDAHENLRDVRQDVYERFCEVNRLFQ